MFAATAMNGPQCSLPNDLHALRERASSNGGACLNSGVDRLVDQMTRIEQAMNALAQKLSPVIKPVPTGMGPKPCDPAEIASPMRTRIDGCVAHAQRIADGIGELISLVEL